MQGITRLAAIAVLTLGFNLFNNDMPLGTHPDEPKKVDFVLRGTQDFKHPVLMLQVNRLCAGVLGIEGRRGTLLLGRTVSAVAGTVVAVASFFLARTVMAGGFALLTALGVGMSPILVMHSHYFKEDMVFTSLLLLTLLAFLGYLGSPGGKRIVLLGLVAGLCVSAHYKGGLLIVLFSLTPVVHPPSRSLRYAGDMLAAALVAAGSFLVVNHAMLVDFSGFQKGFLSSRRQVLKGGSGFGIYPLEQYFSFHLRRSIVPGMTFIPALAGVSAVGAALVRFRSISWQCRVLLLCLAVFYLAVEISPMKAFPGYMRYVIPAVPLLVLFSFKGVEWISRSGFAGKYPALVVLLCGALLLPPAFTSARLTGHLGEDTRDAAERWAAGKGEEAVFELYAGWHRNTWGLYDIDIEEARQRGVRYLVASSFMYDRYRFAATLYSPPPKALRRHRAYEELFRFPFLEISPAFRTFAFSNPTIRIIDISEEPGR